MWSWNFIYLHSADRFPADMWLFEYFTRTSGNSLHHYMFIFTDGSGVAKISLERDASTQTSYKIEEKQHTIYNTRTNKFQILG